MKTATESSTADLKRQTVRGVFAKMCGQVAVFGARIASLMVLGRLLGPKEFGLVGMVTAVVGVLSLFRDFGLSTVTIQRADMTDEELSSLFWMNILVGAALWLITVILSPFVAAFYHEPRLFLVSLALSLGFLLNAAGVQHSALLARQMRFTTLTILETASALGSSGLGIAMAAMGYGYWSLVGMTLSAPLIFSSGVWIAAHWVPGPPRNNPELGRMMRFGGAVAFNYLLVYLAHNADSVLLGRFWGAEAVGLYGRGYQLLNVPTDSVTNAVGGVAFSALSRLQKEPDRLKAYFLKGYSLVISVTLSITVCCAALADDLTVVVLGPKWSSIAPIIRLLAPGLAVLAIINPLGWLLFAMGLIGRSVRLSLVIAPLMIVSYLIAVPYGINGIAAACSVALCLWIAPHVIWSVHGTGVLVREIATAAARPLCSAALGTCAVVFAHLRWGTMATPLARLVAGGCLFYGVYAFIILVVMRQTALYVDALQEIRGRK